MNYYISDIHGQYDAFKKLLEKIDFKKNDTLYIVGGLIDYGHNSIELLQDLMVRTNVFPVMGSHEFALLRFLKNMEKKAAGEAISPKANEAMLAWFGDGGAETAQKVMELSEDDRESISDYLEDMDVYLEITVEDTDYLLAASGIHDYSEDTDLEDYDYAAFLEAEEEDTEITVPGVVLVTGKYPARQDDGQLVAKIIVSETNIKLDCGAGCGGKLGAYCAETGECFYVEV